MICTHPLTRAFTRLHSHQASAARTIACSSITRQGFSLDDAFLNQSHATTNASFTVLNPYSGDVLGTAPNCNKEDALQAVEDASQAFQKWKKVSAKGRSNALKKWIDVIMKNKKPLAELITAESGKPLSESHGEIVYACSHIDWLAEEARRTYGMTIPSTNSKTRLVTVKQPIGVSALITPWNFPAAMITRKASAAIAAGCSVVLKPSEETPFTAIALAQLALEAGIPEGVLNVVPCGRDNVAEVGDVFTSHPDIKAISFTGSTHVGKLLLQQSASTVKKVSLELGGHAPVVVFESADINKAVDSLLALKFRFMGQACISANRVYVQENVYDAFMGKLAAAMNARLISGDPTQRNTTFGPLINQAAVEKVSSHVENARSCGAKVVLGGSRGADGPNFYQPTLLGEVTDAMQCYTEETFGPLVPVIRFQNEEELMSVVNKSKYGLAGYMFSQDVSQCWRVGEQLEFGMVGINETGIGVAEAPFGGIKESGLGREGSKDGLEEFMETKYLCFGI